MVRRLSLVIPAKAGIIFVFLAQRARIHTFRTLVYYLPLLLLAACGDFMEPAESTPKPTAYEFNYWLLNHVYLYEAELANLPAEGDSVPLLYSSLSDRYTRYYPPSESDAAENKMNTSIVEGDLGMEYMVVYTEGKNNYYPITISRVYDDSPAGRAKVPRYGHIIEANGISLEGNNAKAVYDSIVDYSTEVHLTVFFNDSLHHYDLVKETVYAPTVFLDTVSGITFISITEFRLSTADRENGTRGELKAYLDSTTNESKPRVLDLRGNPGGLIDQCLAAADLFIKDGLMSRRKVISFNVGGKRTSQTIDEFAKPGDPGESGKFVVLANRASASCAEIFIAAVTEQGGIPFVGEKTFGKGIGQGQWRTVDGGLAIITNLEFYTPKNNSYNKTGITPDIECQGGASRPCALEAINTFYGTSAPEHQASRLNSVEIEPFARRNDVGGALDTVINFVNYPLTP